jgi:hypothetical protein
MAAITEQKTTVRANDRTQPIEILGEEEEFAESYG